MLTNHTTPDGFSKMPLSMKGQRWKHIVVKGRGEEGVTIFEKMKAISRGRRVNKGGKGINSVKKCVKTRFLT